MNYSTYVINRMGDVPLARARVVTHSALHFRVVRARGAGSREGTISRPSLEVKAAVSGIEIRPGGEEWIVDTCDVITLVSRMYDLSDYRRAY